MAPYVESPESPIRHEALSNGSINGHSGVSNGTMSKPRSNLCQTPQQDLHDLITVGFGPACLAIAAALHDALEDSNTAQSLKTTSPKVAFLERQAQFAWHAGMQIPGAKMQISFMKDMATFRNPRSRFTFINYLHENGRLAHFTNLGTFLPRRAEYEDYLRWCARQFEDLVSYGEEVVDIQADEQPESGKTIASFTVTSRNIASGQLSQRRAKNVVVAVGGRAKIPKSLPQSHPRVIHSSQYRTVSSRMFLDKNQPIKVAVIGGGQSAAEIFDNIPSQFPNSQAFLLIKGPALRPSDDSPL